MSRLLFWSFDSPPPTEAAVIPTVRGNALAHIRSSASGAALDVGGFNGQGRVAWASRAALLAGR